MCSREQTNKTSLTFRIRKKIMYVRCIITQLVLNIKGINLGGSNTGLIWCQNSYLTRPSPCFQLTVDPRQYKSFLHPQTTQEACVQQKQCMWGIKMLPPLHIARKTSVQGPSQNLAPNKGSVLKNTWSCWPFSNTHMYFFKWLIHWSMGSLPHHS